MGARVVFTFFSENNVVSCEDARPSKFEPEPEWTAIEGTGSLFVVVYMG